MFGRGRTSDQDKKTKQQDELKEKSSDQLEATIDAGEGANEGEHATPQNDAEMALRSRLRTAHFADIISVLMRSRLHSKMTLDEVRNKFLPPYLANQYIIAHANAKDGSRSRFPVGVAFWAQVSDEIEARLLAQDDGPAEIGPDEWSSGDNLWIIEIVAHDKVAPMIIGQLQRKVFGDRPFKFRAKDSSGTFHVHELPKTQADQTHATEGV